MTDTIVQSKLIQAYSYDPQTLSLQIVYKSNGHRWSYSPVYPTQVESIFQTAGSIGSKIHKQIKQGNVRALRIG